MNFLRNAIKILLIMSVSTISFNTASGQNKKTSSVRPMAVAGSFYPSTKSEINAMMAEYFKPFAKNNTAANVAATIVPHAGYVYSGSVAAAAFAQINTNAEYEHVFLIGPSHHVYMESGASVNELYDFYETPFGKLKVDIPLCRKLISEHGDCFSCNAAAHDKEHCLEVQLPFLQYHLKKMPEIVPIIIATQSLPKIKQIADALKPYFNKNNLFIISSDFSHYPSYKNAQKVDGKTGAAIESGSLNKFLEALYENSKEKIPNLATSACGQSAIATLLYLIDGDKNIEIQHNQYKNSGDSEYGDDMQVVGYHAFTFVRKSKIKEETTFSLSAQEQQTLLDIARGVIQNKLNHTNAVVYKETELTVALRATCGAFVTLTENGNLRGCIGLFGSELPLYRVVENMAESAAFGDPRFYPLSASEFNKIKIEISVLSPMKKINSIDEFTLGKHGIYISKDGRSGTFLPQVANEVDWNKEEFLSHCAHDKAGLAWDGWKTADLYTYEAFVFKEK